MLNRQWEIGHSTSIRVGLNALSSKIDAAIFINADQPFLTRDVVNVVIQRFRETDAEIIVPEFAGRRGNPVLFDRVTFNDLLALSGDVGGRAVFAKHRATYVPWHDARLLLDVDTPEDYQRLQGLEDQSI